jgi:hypothetical protein
MSNLIYVVGQLKKERERAAKEVQRLDVAIAALNGSKYGKQTSRRPLSADARERIASAQRVRWTKFRAGQKANGVAMPKRRTMSAAARKRIAAAQKARWAKVKVARKA